LSRIRFLFAIAATTVAATGLVACGGGGGNSDASPQSVLDGATMEGVESANLEAKVEVVASGSEGGEVDVTLSGPFESVEGGSTPKLDMTAKATGTVNGKDVNFEGGLVLLPNSAYVGYEGTEYEVDPTTYSFIESAMKQAQQQGARESESAGTSACQKAVSGLRVGDFLDNLKNEGEADVGGTPTTKVSGDLEVGGAIDALLKLYSDPACSSQLSAAGELPSISQLRAAKDEVSKAVKVAHVDVYVGEDDIIRRVAGELMIEPKDTGSGPGSATVNFDVSLEGVNEDQEINAPEKAKPLNDLFLKLGVNPLELLGALQGEGAGGLGNLLEGMHAESPNGL
jgi:hypothetical protein